MRPGLLKVDPGSPTSDEDDFDLEYYRSLTTAQRFQMMIERSILLRRLAEPYDTGRKPPALVKRI